MWERIAIKISYTLGDNFKVYHQIAYPRNKAGSYFSLVSPKGTKASWLSGLFMTGLLSKKGTQVAVPYIS
jgi:hypothetical protein